MDGNLIALDREVAKRVFSSKDDASIRALAKELTKDGETPSLALPAADALASAYEALAASREGSGLAFAILGGRPLHQGPEWVIRLVRPDVVRGLAGELNQLADASEHLDSEELQREHQAVAAFYASAAENACAVLFAAPSA